MYFLWKLLIAIFSYSNSSLSIITLDTNYAAIKAKHLSTYIKYEDEITSGGMIKGSWSIGGHDSHHTYECSGVAGATDC
jgi:hypothetical protein